MLSSFESNILELIRCSLKNEKPEIDDNFDFETAYEFAQERHITPLLYYSGIHIPKFMDSVAGKKFFQSTMRLGYFCYEQNKLVKEISEAFKENKIQFLMVKGTVIQEMYPYIEMRLMSDADILIKEVEYPRIKPIMESLGFEEAYESNHELVWKKQGFTVELHKLLVPSYNKDYFAYFGDGWKLATIKDDDSFEYFMKDEDNFIYTFVHYAMHYRNGGIGVKHVTDFYVIMQKNPGLDFGYIEKELEKLNLLKFWENTKKLLDVWFNSQKSDEITEFMTMKIFNSGAYGTAEDKLNSEAIRTSNDGKNVKLKKLMHMIFLPYSGMCQKYRFLKKLPFLLPIMWVVRWITALFRPSKLKAQKDSIGMISDESVSKFHNELNYVGLDFDF